MRIMQLAALAAFVAAGSLSVSAQQSTPPAAAKTKMVACKKRDEAACQPPECKWVAAKGKTKAHCATAPKPKKPAAPKPQ